MQAAIPFPDISPEIFVLPIFGVEFALRWYAMSYIVSLLIGWRLVVAMLRRPRLWPNETPPMTAEQVDDLLTWVILRVILGGRLGFVVFYQPAYYLQNPGEILQVWQGGMSFHGGLLGVVIACALFARRHKIRFLWIGDMLCAVAPIGMLLGRMANFVNGELWGRATDVPWAVIFPGDAAQFCPGVEGACARHPSQLYEAGLEGLLLGFVTFWLIMRLGALARPGVTAGVFFAGYGAARFIVEFVRQPDAHFVAPGNPLGLALHIDGVGLTMGQILSLPMIAIGLFMILRARDVRAVPHSA